MSARPQSNGPKPTRPPGWSSISGSVPRTQSNARQPTQPTQSTQPRFREVLAAPSIAPAPSQPGTQALVAAPQRNNGSFNEDIWYTELMAWEARNKANQHFGTDAEYMAKLIPLLDAGDAYWTDLSNRVQQSLDIFAGRNWLLRRDAGNAWGYMYMIYKGWTREREEVFRARTNSTDSSAFIAEMFEYIGVMRNLGLGQGQCQSK